MRRNDAHVSSTFAAVGYCYREPKGARRMPLGCYEVKQVSLHARVSGSPHHCASSFRRGVATVLSG